jgi:hypothetical protein
MDRGWVETKSIFVVIDGNVEGGSVLEPASRLDLGCNDDLELAICS